MKPIIAFNDVVSCTIITPLGINGTAIYLSSGDGAKLPVIGTTSVLLLTIIPAGTLTITDATPYETILVTAINGNNLTVERGYGASLAQSWIAGSNVVNVDNAEYFNYVQGYIAEANKQIYVDSYNATNKTGDIKITANNNQLPCWELMSMAGRGFIGAGTFNGATYVAEQEYGSNDAIVVEHGHGYSRLKDSDGNTTPGTPNIDHPKTYEDHYTSGALDLTTHASIGTSGINKNLPAVKAEYIYKKTRDLTVADLS
jgi:hypothetical protein